MANADSDIRITTGQLDFSGGVDSHKPPTIASPAMPQGIQPNQLVWLYNGTIHNGTIHSRSGWKYLLTMPFTALFQEATMYAPLQDAFPYSIAQIGGRTFKVDVDTLQVVEITIPGNPNPADRPQSWMVQGEQFEIIQDGVSPALFWDGATLRRSAGQIGLVLGIVAADFIVPAVGSYVLIDLTAPYQGDPNEVIYVNGATFQATASGNFITVDKSITSYPGSVIKAGAEFQTRLVNPPPPYAPHQPLAFTAADFVVPIAGVPVTVAVTEQYNGPTPIDASLFDKFGNYNEGTGVGQTTEDWRIVSATVPPAGPNQVYLTNLTAPVGGTVKAGTQLFSAPELPTAECMDYYMGRIWLAFGREYLAGDIVGGPSGTAAYNLNDSILKMTENTFLSLGGAFKVPDQGGNIRALKHPVTLDTALGEGQLFPITRERVYSCNVVPTRAAWKTLSEPIQRVAQINFGTTSDRSVVGVNGDLFMQSVDGIRSMTEAVRYFEQWGNVPISVEENRALDLNDKSLLRFGSGILFDNRMMQTALPYQTPVGVAHKCLLPLNFDTIQTLTKKDPPAWEGVLQGIPILRVLTANFGGRNRAFIYAYGNTGNIELWEMTADEQFDTNRSGESRITWAFETPAYTWQNPFKLKELDTIELWADQIFGDVEFFVEFRPDQHPCWEFWWAWKVCAPRNDCDLITSPFDCYPTQSYQPGYEIPMVLPKAPSFCERRMARPVNMGFTFQFRVTIKGSARIRGLMAHAFERDRAPYDRMTCGTGLSPSNTPKPMITI